VVEALTAQRVLSGIPVSRLYPEREDLADLLLVAVTETVTEADVHGLLAGLAGALL
jgi:glycine cleavage system P protein (glycine dehydrogenase) subunit 1